MDCGARAVTCGVLWSRSVRPAEQVDGHVPEAVADREALAVQLDATVGDELVEAQLAQQDVQPPFPGDPGRPRIGCALLVAGIVDAALELLPDLQQVQPGPGCLPADRLAALQPVGVRLRARAPAESPANTRPSSVGGQQPADDLQEREVGHDAPPPGPRQVDVDAEHVGGFLRADGDLAARPLAAGFTDPDVILAQACWPGRRRSCPGAAAGRAGQLPRARRSRWPGRAARCRWAVAASRACTSSAGSHSASAGRPR